MADSTEAASNTSIKEIIKAVSLKFFYNHLAKDSVFEHFEKLKSCCCDQYGNSNCRCAAESQSSSQNETSDDHRTGNHSRAFSEDGANAFYEEHYDTDGPKYKLHIDETDDTGAEDEKDPKMIHYSHKHFNWFNRNSLYSSISDHKIMKNPFVLIIGNIKFKRRAAPRSGGSADLEHIKVFCRHIDIHEKSIHIKIDLTKEQMVEEMKYISEDVSLCDYDSFICFIMSHGNKDGVLGTDNDVLSVDNIVDIFRGSNCPYLITKPKLFFIQACRGKHKDTGVYDRGTDIKTDDDDDDDDDITGTNDRPVKIPSDADIMIAYSTTKGNVSMRKHTINSRCKSMGSWFIYSLVYIFCKYSHKEDLMTMMTRVNQTVSVMFTGDIQEKGLKQIPCQLSMLRYKLYFGNYSESSSK